MRRAKLRRPALAPCRTTSAASRAPPAATRATVIAPLTMPGRPRIRLVVSRPIPMSSIKGIEVSRELLELQVLAVDCSGAASQVEARVAVEGVGSRRRGSRLPSGQQPGAKLRAGSERAARIRRGGCCLGRQRRRVLSSGDSSGRIPLRPEADIGILPHVRRRLTPVRLWRVSTPDRRGIRRRTASGLASACAVASAAALSATRMRTRRSTSGCTRARGVGRRSGRTATRTSPASATSRRRLRST